MGRGADERIFEVERSSNDNLEEFDRLTIGGLKRQLDAALKAPSLSSDALRRFILKAGSEIEAAEQASTIDEFQSALGEAIGKLEPSDEDALVRQLFYPLAYGEEEATLEQLRCVEAANFCATLSEVQALWCFADAPEPLKVFSEEAEAADFVLWQSKVANFLGEGPRKHCFLMRELSNGWIIYYRSAVSGEESTPTDESDSPWRFDYSDML